VRSDDNAGPLRHHDARRHLLIVDDETSILFAMRDYFCAHGYVVDCARDRQEAEALLARETYGVVIADLRLDATGEDAGLAVIGCVRERCPSTGTILLTAYGPPTVVVEARRRGVDAILHKPRSLPEIAGIVETLLAAT
jgi:DNA-binding NtrC family response regulator